MARYWSRIWLGAAGLFALALVGYALLRSGSNLSGTPAKSAAASDSGVSSKSRPAEWVMEGGNPARTRAHDAGIALPINRRREIRLAKDEGTGSPIAVAQNIMLVEGEHRLVALDLRNGKVRWTFDENGQYISPAVAGDTVFIRAEADNKGQFFALDVRTGAQRWAFTPRRLSSAATGFWGGHLTSPVIADGAVFIGAGKELYALDAATGAVRWEYGAAEYLSSSATVGDDHVFISDAGHLHAIDRRTGKLAWKSATTFAVYFAPVVAEQTVFVTNGEKVLALNAVDGTRRWETGIDGQTLIPVGAQGSRLFVKSTTALYALDLGGGDELWRFENPNFVSFPVIAGDQLFAVTGATGQTTVAVLDVVTGKRLWDQVEPSLASAAPVIAGQTLYVRTNDGRVVGLFN